MRYIDDLIFIWKGADKEFLKFTQYLITISWALRFSGDINSKDINYLNLTLFPKIIRS